MKETLKARIGKWAPTVASAALLFLAFPPVHLKVFVFIAVVPWLYSLTKEDARYAGRSGFLFGFLVGLSQLYFIPKLAVDWTGSVALSIIPYILACIVYGLYHAVLGRVLWSAIQSKQLWLLPLIWTGWEVARSYIPGLAFPWSMLATPLYDSPNLVQLAYFGTVYAVSAWVMIANVLVTKIFLGTHFTRLRSWYAVFILLFAASIIRANMPQEGTVTTFTAGQPGVNMAFTSQDGQDSAFASIVPVLAEEAKAQGSKLLILPEGLVLGGDGIPPETSFEVPRDMPLIFGGKRGTNPAHQAAFAYDGTWSYADKTRLVPFGEYVPGRAIFPGIATVFKLPDGDIVPGKKVKAVTVNGLKVGALLCFEGQFHDVAQAQADDGAQVLAVMCIDDWYFGTSAPEQLMSASIFRAIETGLPVVRACGLGYSIGVDQRGEIIADAPLGKLAALKIDVKVPEKTTRFPLVRLFPWLAFICFAGWLLGGRWLSRMLLGKSVSESEPKSDF
ncbi:MAG: apolipoprotein N-acyltransferase [Fimbriimonadaceae bacterium]|nr:apolipoprotein N-acyltransferase [Fimbriimonadaceae bacterium]